MIQRSQAKQWHMRQEHEATKSRGKALLQHPGKEQNLKQPATGRHMQTQARLGSEIVLEVQGYLGKCCRRGSRHSVE